VPLKLFPAHVKPLAQDMLQTRVSSARRAAFHAFALRRNKPTPLSTAFPLRVNRTARQNSPNNSIHRHSASSDVATDTAAMGSFFILIAPRREIQQLHLDRCAA